MMKEITLHNAEAKHLRLALSLSGDAEDMIKSAQHVTECDYMRVFLRSDADGFYIGLAMFDKENDRCATIALDKKWLKYINNEAKKLYPVARMLDRRT